jgi:two-component system, sporulation sensor kinase E
MVITSDPEINILLVDDRRENLLALEAALQPLECNLVYASSGEDALKQVLQRDFAAVLLDVQMPGMNGFETARLIKARERSIHIPIIFITAISQAEEHVLGGYSSGAIDYIFKPFHPEALRMKLGGLISMYKHREQLKLHSKLLTKRTLELEETNEKLREITLVLHKAETLNRVIIETSADTILTFDRLGYIQSANRAAVAVLGYNTDELIGMNMMELFPLENKLQFTTDILHRLFPRHDKIVETELTSKDGRTFPADLQIGEAVIDEVMLMVCFIRDITERRQLEQERKDRFAKLERLVTDRTKELLQTNTKLHHSQERFRKIFESSPSMIGIRSMEDGKFIDVNESWLNSTGYTYQEMLMCEGDILRFASTVGDGTSEPLSSFAPNTRNLKVSYMTKDGSIRDGLVSTEVIEIQTMPCELIVLTDITGQLHLEKEVARLDRLNLIGEMAAGIAHEIRNPMTTVRGFLQVIQAKGSPDFTTHIALMLAELDRANSIITEFLTLAKTKMTFQKSQLLNPIVEALFPLIQAEALMSDKEVRVNLRKCPPLLLDEKEVRQLILNIALNGLEAMLPGGVLTIETEHVDGEVILSIKDQGEGIKDEWLDKLGTPFFTTKETGTGLGLAICYSVAARHHAVIDVLTGEDGTTFKIRFQEVASILE